MIVRPAQPIATSNKINADRRAVFASLNNEAGEIDLLIAQRTERFGQLKCIYVDTGAQDANGNGCIIVTDLGQNITVPAQTQGYYPIFVPYVSKLNVSSNEAVNLLLLDFDVQPANWGTQKKTNAPASWSFIDNTPVTIANTLAFTQLFSLPIPANTLGPASIVQLNFNGTFINGTGVSRNFDWFFTGNGDWSSSVQDVTGALATVTGTPHAFNWNILCAAPLLGSQLNNFRLSGIYSMGRARQWTAGLTGYGDLGDILTLSQGVVSPFKVLFFANFDASVDNTLDCAIQFPVADPNLSITLDNITAKQVN